MGSKGFIANAFTNLHAAKCTAFPSYLKVNCWPAASAALCALLSRTLAPKCDQPPILEPERGGGDEGRNDLGPIETRRKRTVQA